MHAVHLDKLKNTENILANLSNPIYKMYLLFLSYILDIVNAINIEFQSEKPKIHTLLKRLTELYKTILKNYLKSSYINNTPVHIINNVDPQNFLLLENMYFGANVELLLSTSEIDVTEVQKFKTNCLAFYIELCTQIKSRFNFNDPLLKLLSNFAPDIVVSGDVLSIVSIVQHFPQIIINIEKLNSEWRLLSDVEELKLYINDFEIFWNKVISMKNSHSEQMFPNLSKVIKAIMSLPHSSACAERIFSQLALLKTKIRNRLLTDTCEAILLCKGMMGASPCYSWEPSQHLINKKVVY